LVLLSPVCLSVDAVHFSSHPLKNWRRTASEPQNARNFVKNLPNPSDYIPKAGLRNGDLMTLYAWGKRREFPELPPPDSLFFDVTPETRVLGHCHWQPKRNSHPALVGLHGLESSSSAHYMQGLADKAFRAGFNVVLLNQRNCGGTEQYGPGLYHSGLTADARFVLCELLDKHGVDRVVVAGYSLGGNLALKLAGEYGDAQPSQLRGVAAVSPVMDLASCVAALERRRNIVYHLNFVRGLRGRMRRKDRLYPGRYPIDRLERIWSVREFDEVYTAPHFGFASAADYYHRASALRVVDRIRVPALILTAEDDPFVPPASFRDAALTSNPHVHVTITRHGGHCGFVTAPSNGNDGYWAESEIVRMATAVCG
jgi:predicted alpha/beta-fold hydrolase